MLPNAITAPDEQTFRRIMRAAELERQAWPARMAALRSSGTPLNAYNNVISRSDAQALIPEDVVDTMLKGVSNQAAAMSLFTRIPVAQSQVRLPILSALPTAYWVNGETGLKQTTEVNWTNRYLNIEELAAIVPIPEATLEDTSFDVWGSVRPLLENAIARALDAAVFFGLNAPGTFPTNIAAAAAAAGNTIARGTNAAAAGGIVGDFSDLFGTVEADGYMVDGVVASTTYRGRLRQARATTGESLVESDDGQVTAASVFGIPITYPMRGLWPAPGAGAVEAFAFERDQFVLGLRRDFTYKVLDQAVIQDNTGAIIYNLAQQDMVALRVTFRVGWQVANTINYDQSVEAARYPAAVLHQ